MMNLISQAYGWEAGRWVALAATVAVLFFACVLFPRATGKTGSAKNSVIDLQLASDVGRFREVLLGWSESNDRAVALMKCENIIKLDIIFPFVYALAFAFAYAWARGEGPPTRLDAALFLYPFIAGLFDLFENGLHLYLLRDVETRADVVGANFSPVLVAAAAAFAYSKLLLLVTSLGAIIAALITSRGPLLTAAVAVGVIVVGALFNRLKNAF